MEIGDEIIIRGKIVDFDGNPHHGPAVKIKIKAFEAEKETLENLKQRHQGKRVQFMYLWVHALDQPEVVVK